MIYKIDSNITNNNFKMKYISESNPEYLDVYKPASTDLLSDLEKVYLTRDISLLHSMYENALCGNPDIAIYELLCIALLHCSFDTFKWIYNTYSFIKTNTRIKLMLFAIENDKMHLLDELILLKDANNLAFEFNCLCGMGEFVLMKHYYNALNKEIDLSNTYEMPFRAACYNGHLNIAKWLYSVKPDINIFAVFHSAFKSAFEHGHLDVVLWLQTVCPSKYFIRLDKNNRLIDYLINESSIKLQTIPPVITTPTKIALSNEDEDEERIECSICFEMECNIVTDCNHLLCEWCLIKYIGTTHTATTFSCPYCRHNVECCYRK
jgi:hypothetical protein